MSMRAALAGFDIVLCGTAVATVAPFIAAGSLCIEGELFGRLATEDGWLLVLDHRDSASAERRAYVECWRPVARLEGDLSVLIVLGDARPEAAERPDLPGPYTLEELARRLL
jgi:hypothetical protein